MSVNFRGLVNGEEMNRFYKNRKVGQMKSCRHQEAGRQNFHNPVKIRNGCEFTKMDATTCKTLLHIDEIFLQRKHNNNE